MELRKRAKAFIKKPLALLSKNQSNAVDSAGAKTTQDNQERADAIVPSNTNGSTVDQVGTNEVVKQPEALRVLVKSTTLENIPIRELWNVAYENLREEDNALIAAYETKLQGSVVAGLGETLKQTTNIRERMSAILQSKMNEVNKNIIKLKLGSTEVKMRDAAQLVLDVVGSANSYITQAVSANPYASIAWAGVSFLLPLFMNISSQNACQAKGLKYISSLIAQSQMREEIYIKRYESQASGHEEFQRSHREYKAALERLYRQILRFQAKICCHYSNNSALRHGLDAVMWDDWDQLVNNVCERDTEFAAIEQIWRDVQRLEERLADRVAISQKERKELLDWLCDVDPSSLYKTARKGHEAGTNEWLIKDSKEFKTWETSAGSLLWLHGKAGSGKSVLSSSVISYLKDQYASKPSTALAYFYFSFSDVEKQKTDVMLASLIKQIYHRGPDVPEVNRIADYRMRNERPDTETLEAALTASISGFSAVYVVIDGLDECPLLGGQRDELLKSLRHILSSSLKNFHIFLTSRKEPDIDLEIRDLLSPPLRIEIDLLTHQYMLNEDIRQYIDITLATNKFKSWPPSVKEEARQSLIEKADCMFQYVRFQFEILQKVSSESEIHEALQNLPVGLDATYNRIVKNIDTKFRTRVINSLKWLAFSRTVLTIDELSEIFIINPDNGVAFNKEERLFSSTDVLKYFSGLIITQERGRFWFTEGTGRKQDELKVRLVHFSVKEYLTSDRIRESSISTFSFREIDAHIFISRSCLAYLAHISTKASRVEDYPLAHYVAKFWALHLEEIPRKSWPTQVAKDAVLALTIHSQSLFTLIHMQRIRLGVDKHLWVKPLCYAARSGYRQLTEALMTSEISTYQYLTQEDLDRGLQYATWGGNMDIIRLFLKEGAKIDGNCGVHGFKSAVDAAVHVKNYKALELFESKGADVKGLAAQNWGVESLKFALKLGANIDGQLDGRGTALHKALFNGELEIFDLLLERGADVNALNEKLGTPLQSACTVTYSERFHSLSRIEDLLNHGADSNIRGGRYATALQAACYTGLRSGSLIRSVKQIVQLLIRAGADLNIQGGEYGTALHAAAASPLSGAVEVMKLLVDSGAKINQQGGDNWGASLQVACYEGTIEAVRFLLDQGADVNAEGGCRFGTPLQAAAARGEIETYWHEGGKERFTLQTKLQILQMLISKGAEVNHQGGEWGTALQAACARMDREVLHLLLENGADVNACGGKHGTALIVACKNLDFWEIDDVGCVLLLLDRGADVNAQGGDYGTALIATCQNSDWKSAVTAAQLLVDHGADVNAQGGKHGNVLSTACRRGHFELVQLLLKRGANIHLQDFGAWYAAARCSNPNVLQHLLDHGMNVNHVHKEHGTALHVIMGNDQHVAEDRGWRAKFDVLSKNGIDASIMNETLGSALHVGCAIKHGEEWQDHFRFPVLTDANYTSGNTKYLLEQYTNIDVNARGGIFDSALQAAAYSGQTLSVNLLLDRNADVNMCGGKYRSALNGAIVSGYWDIVDILLKAGATPDCRLQEHPDEEWLRTVLEEDGRGAVERYRKFWEVEMRREKEA